MHPTSTRTLKLLHRSLLNAEERINPPDEKLADVNRGELVRIREDIRAARMKVRRLLGMR